jgi:hypothetical protein
MYKECRHIMPRGCRCHSPALAGKPYCYHHARLNASHNPGGRPATELPHPDIEDMHGIQIALGHTLRALSAPWLDSRRAGLVLYGLQIATNIAGRIADLPSREVVRACEESEDNALAPERTVCEPPRDCIRCRQKETCDKYEEPDDYEDEEFEEEEPEEQEVSEGEEESEELQPEEQKSNDEEPGEQESEELEPEEQKSNEEEPGEQESEEEEPGEQEARRIEARRRKRLELVA